MPARQLRIARSCCSSGRPVRCSPPISTSSPNGSPSGNGSINSPWDLQTALNQPSTVHPGDTIWLRGGTYVGHFTSNLNGTSSSPIIVRQYAGERATIDGN